MASQWTLLVMIQYAVLISCARCGWY